MQNEFKFKIENFGPINEANFNLNKITVIGGVNASGKSFSARLLFCIVTVLSKEGLRIDNESIKNLFTDLIKRHGLDFSSVSANNDGMFLLASKLNDLMKSWNDYDVSYEFLDDFYKRFHEIIVELDGADFNDDLKKIRKVVDSHLNKFQYVISVLRFLLIAEFGADQVINFDGANIRILMEKFDCEIEYNINFTSDALKIYMCNENQISCIDFDNVIYMDSISAMDFQLNGRNIHYHYISLMDFLTNVKPINSNGVYDNIDAIMKINKKFNGMLDGSFKLNPLTNIFSFESCGESYDVRNIASGYKQVGVLQKLLNNNQISDKTLLIFDDPETNLHPNFQIQLAEILVQMVNELDLMIYINSHSPHFIEALEVYSTKYGLKNKTNFYLSECGDECNKFDIELVSQNHLYDIYDNLGNAYDVVDRVRGENIANHR